MADHKQTPQESTDFLGGGPKFNTVGRDNRSAAGAEEPIIPINQTNYWLRVAGILAVLLLLAGLLFFLNENNLGKATAPPGHGAISSDTHEAVPVTPDAK